MIAATLTASGGANSISTGQWDLLVVEGDSAASTPDLPSLRSSPGGRPAVVGFHLLGTPISADGVSLPLETQAMAGVLAGEPRRLTPLEWERLQGLPDEWTRWGADGRVHSDTARYRMVGNGAAVPVFEWVGRRILQAMEVSR